MRRPLVPTVLAALCAAPWAACGPASDDVDGGVEAAEGVRARVDFTAAAEGGDAFFDAPFPSDLRRTPTGAPDLSGLRGREGNPTVDGLAALVDDLRGFSQLQVAWLRFDGGSLPELGADTVWTGDDEDAPLLLVDVDPDSPERGRRWPLLAHTPAPDAYVPPGLLALSPVSGFVLRPDTTYAYAVRRGLGDADGAPLGRSEAMAELLSGVAPAVDGGEAYAAQVTDALDVLAEQGVGADDLAALTVFTTGDVAADVEALSEAVRDRWSPSIEDLAVAPDRGLSHETYCELHGTLTVPQFQQGEAPFDTEGLFELDGDGVPVEQRSETIPVVVTVPRAPMPPEGYPLGMYFHGSGGVADQLVTRGPQPGPGEPPALGFGPAHVLATHGFAAAGSAHPISPDRVPGAFAFAYLNFANLPAFRDTFRQGIVEQRLYLDALLDLSLDPELLEGCDGVSLPDGASAITFDGEAVVAMGQSMGGMYTNLIGSVEPRIGAVVPTGAGGHWTRMVLVTELLGEGTAASLLKLAVGTNQDLTYLHPAVHAAQMGWEMVEPLVYLRRLAQQPLPGHPVRPIYQPAGRGDSYFPTGIYDAFALAYGNQRAGDAVWESMDTLLSLDDRSPAEGYEVVDNRVSEDGTPYTGVVVQYAGDGFSDPHVIFTQLDEVKHQYGCFFETWLRDGSAVVPDGDEAGGPCP